MSKGTPANIKVTELEPVVKLPVVICPEALYKWAVLMSW